MVDEGFLEELKELKKELEKGCMITMNGKKNIYFMNEKAGELFEKVSKVLEEEEQEKEEKKPKTVWDLKENDEYWIIDDEGYVYDTVWTDESLDKRRRACGNAFLTYDEAAIEVQKREIEAELRKYGGVSFKDPEYRGNGEGYSISYYKGFYYEGGAVEDESISAGSRVCDGFVDAEDLVPFVFETEDLAKDAIQKIGEKRLIAYVTGELYEDKK